MSADPLAKVLAEHEYDVHIAGTIKPACKCGWEAPKEWSGVEVYDEHLADAVRAYLTSAETVERAAKAIHAERWHEDGDCHDPSGCGPTSDDVREARAALAAATETRP